MSGTVITITLCVAVWALFVALVTMPRWFARSLHGHRLWRLRDELADALIAGRLPQDHEAVQDLLLTAQFAAERGKRWTMIDVYLCWLVMRRMDPESRAALEVQANIPYGDLSAAEVELFEGFRERFAVLVTGSMLLGSWVGLATVAWFFPRALREVLRDKGPDVTGRVVRWGKSATDLAATHTRLGQQSAHLVAHQHAMSATPLDRPTSTFTFRS